MNEKYIGKVCPYCKTPFIEEDEIVVCNTCDMPHHKSCWVDNQGCTTFGCLGTIKTADGSQTSVTTNEIHYEEQSTQNVIYCTMCGTQNKQEDSFCKQCGNALHRTNTNVNTNTNVYATNTNYNNNFYQSSTNYSAYQTNQTAQNSEVAQFVGVNTEYYIPKFQQMQGMNTKVTWNWSAFLVTPYWCIYRKMYAYGAGVLGINFMLNAIGGVFMNMLSFAIFILAGIFGNYIYMQDIQRRIAKSKNISEPYRTQYVAQNSGVNSTAVILVAVGFCILAGILYNI